MSKQHYIDCVTPKWISTRMLYHGVKLKKIALDTGLNYTQLSAIINGKKPLSKVSKAMFYYYFNHINQNKINNTNY